jgi:hypothetical protein
MRLRTWLMSGRYYRHFKLYEYALRGRVHMSLEQAAPHGLETVAPPRPLSEGVLMPDASSIR